MSSTLEGTLAYGFDIGGVDGEWHLKNLDATDAWKPSWVTWEEWAQEGGYDYQSGIAERLENADLGLQVITYGMTQNDCTGYVIAAWSMSCAGSKTKPVYLEDIETGRHVKRWDEALSRALQVLDIRPWQPNPTFLLTQSYG